MLDEHIFFINKHHRMDDPEVPDRQARSPEATIAGDVAADVPATSEDEPKKRGLFRLIGALYRMIRSPSRNAGGADSSPAADGPARAGGLEPGSNGSIRLEW
jgi:hypothetical protein